MYCASPVWDFSACLCPRFYLLRCWFPFFFFGSSKSMSSKKKLLGRSLRGGLQEL